MAERDPWGRMLHSKGIPDAKASPAIQDEARKLAFESFPNLEDAVAIIGRLSAEELIAIVVRANANPEDVNDDDVAVLLALERVRAVDRQA